MRTTTLALADMLSRANIDDNAIVNEVIERLHNLAQPAVPEEFEKALDALADGIAETIRTKGDFSQYESSRAELTRLYALAAAPAVTWRPIETAPKDGTELLIFDPVDGPARAHWSTHNWYAGTYVAAPTHWMPLPAPPALNVAPEPGK